MWKVEDNLGDNGDSIPDNFHGVIVSVEGVHENKRNVGVIPGWVWLLLFALKIMKNSVKKIKIFIRNMLSTYFLLRYSIC